MNNLVETFITLCSIPSPSGNEMEIREYLVKHLRPLVDALYVDEAGNIYASKNGEGEPILYCAHMDTVEPAGRQKPVIKDGVIHSDGSVVLGADDKIAVAAILQMLEDLQSNPVKHRALEILITVREETDAGIRSFPRERIKSTQCLVSDISLPVGTVLRSAPYVGGYSIDVHAPGSHVARSTKDTVHPLKFLSEFVQKHPYGRLAEDTIVNIAKIRMGESYNSIPQKLSFTGEIRTFNADTYNSFLKHIPESAREIDKVIGTQSQVQLYPYCTGYTLKPAHLSHIKSVMEKLKIPYEEATTFSVGDFNILNEWGIVTVNIGNGDIEAHTTRERVSIESLLHIRDIFYEYALNKPKS
ncbi:MAG: hypothetical protein RI947_152 [Candidatus Parcubacteria bacterium]|jgi:tripeptide aminopeptidase